jgi:membrane-bound lytic murein transglycosylase D
MPKTDAILRGLRVALPVLVAGLSACGHHNAGPTTGAAPESLVATDSAPSTHPSLTDSTSGSDGPMLVTHSQVTRQALRVFGDSVGALADSGGVGGGAGGADATAPGSPPGPTWDIDVRSYATQRRVAYYVGRFSGEARDVFTLWVERGTRYEPLIRKKLRAASLPEDMAYLPIIESGYSPDAYSSAAAVGLWQLMTSTAQGAGLRVDWWVDERRDPVRSTDAAIRFLRYLKDQFGSIYLAAAAYDGGPGRISRGLARYADDFAGTSGDDLFFALADKKYLRLETKEYVPQLIAAALVAKEPARYGLHVVPMPVYVYDTVRVPASTPLAAVAKASSTTTATLGDLNPHILRGVTPPRDSFTVRVPVGAAAGFDSIFGALPPAEREAYTHLTSRKGETYGMLSQRAGVSVHILKTYNPKVKPLKSGHIPVGTAIVVPTRAVAAAALDVPDPSIERYGSGRSIHIVKQGESLGRIAEHYHTSVATLMRLNGLRKSTILPGQALVVSGSPVHHSHHSS